MQQMYVIYFWGISDVLSDIGSSCSLVLQSSYHKSSSIMYMVCKQDGCFECNLLFELTNMIDDENISENEKKKMVKTEAVYPRNDLAQTINGLSINGKFGQFVKVTYLFSNCQVHSVYYL